MITKVRVYDLPTRFFHWIFAIFFLSSFFITKFFEDDSEAYPYHMMSGLVLSLAVCFRILWGLWGSRYAKFTSFPLSPLKLLNYFKGVISKGQPKDLGHNPASSWASIVMMILALCMGFTGLMMAQDINKEFFEDIHELSADIFIIVVIGHVLGIIIHSLQYRDGIGLSMVHGRKKTIAGHTAISSSHSKVGYLFLVLMLAFIFYLVNNYDPTQRQLNLFGATLQLGDVD